MSSSPTSFASIKRRPTNSMTNAKHSSTMSLSASQSSSAVLTTSTQANNSSPAVFSFRPHVLLSEPDSMHRKKGSSLDYTELSERIAIFKELFNLHLEHATTAIEKSNQEHTQKVSEEQRNTYTVKERIERQKEEQKALYQAVEAERRAESSAQSQLALLQASRTSLTQRLHETEAERVKLQDSLDRRRREYEGQKTRLQEQARRNRPELQRFNEKLGLRISSGRDADGQIESILKFTFNLIDPADWTYEASFVIDARTKVYKILSAKPALPSEQLEQMLAHLNRTRTFFVFIKRMRSAFKEQIERDRLHKQNV